eukprot:1139990-Pelagomonas_calceolata.AAC.10
MPGNVRQRRVAEEELMYAWAQNKLQLGSCCFTESLTTVKQVSSNQEKCRKGRNTPPERKGWCIRDARSKLRMQKEYSRVSNAEILQTLQT